MIQLRPRLLWLVPGLAIAVYASMQATAHGLGIVPLLVFTIVPDIPRLLGVGQSHPHGRMASRAVPLFNLLHHPVPPLVLLGIALTGVVSPLWLAGSIAWLGHVVIGLGIGDRLRTHDGRLRSHWLFDLDPMPARAPEHAVDAKAVETPV